MEAGDQRMIFVVRRTQVIKEGSRVWLGHVCATPATCLGVGLEHGQVGKVH